MRIFAITVLVFFAWSCSPENKPVEESIRTYDTSTLYYDIPLAVTNELSEIKRNLSFISAINSINGEKDTTEIDTTRLMQLAAPFLQYNLNESRYRKFYREDIKEDGDLRKIVLTYSTNHPDFALKLAEVWLNNETQDLTNINITRLYTSKDSVYDETLTWAAGRSFMVLQKISAGGKELIKQTKVSWRDR